MKQRIVTVFGGSGFLGRHLVRHLAPSGVQLRIAVRDPEAAKFLKPLGGVGQIVPLHAHVRDPASIARALAGADAVVNLVGILNERPHLSFEQVHHQGAAKIAAAAAAAGVARLVHVSAIGADPASPSAYARSKGEGESAVRAAFPGASILRPSVVFGPEDDFFNRFGALARLVPVLPVFFDGLPRIDLMANFPWPSVEFHAGRSRMQPVFAGDVAEAIVRALDAPHAVGETYELGGPTVYSMAELMAFVLEQTGRSPWLVPIHTWIAHLMGFAFEQAVLPFAFIGKYPAPLLTRDQVKLLKSDNVVGANARNLSDLGIAPLAVEAVVPDYLTRFRSGPVRSSENSEEH
jgi:uncharacterized protein YbjT (DUF2867 family)